jgi:tripartite-type tricarboxylate transporter receptor subunit TctC
MSGRSRGIGVRLAADADLLKPCNDGLQLRSAVVANYSVRMMAPQTHSLQRAALRTLFLIGVVAACLGAASAETWPQRPIKLLVPFAAGGNIDIQGRLMAHRLSESLGQQVVVENRVGGNGIVATEAVARAPADGYTLLWASTSVIAIVPAAAAGKVPYDPVRDFAPISALSAGPQVLLVNAKVPAKTVAEFVAWVKAQPNKLAYGGGGGPASASNLIMSLFLKRAQLQMTNVSYRGTAPAMNDLIAGHIPAMFAPVAEAYAQATNPNVRMLGVSSGTRSKRIPDVPTIAEAGYPGFYAVSWTGLMAPAGTPKEVIDRLAAEVTSAVRDPKFVEQLTLNGVDPLGDGPEKFAAMIAAEIPIWADAVRIGGVKLQ